MHSVRQSLVATVVFVVVAGCSTSPQPTGASATYPLLPTFPVPPEALASPVASIPQEFGKATWAIDGSLAAPDSTTRTLHILVWEQACSGGVPATGRISPPVIVYSPTTVTITLGVRPIQVPSGYLVTCPGPPGTPATVELSEPLGSRQLLDGGRTPPAPPSPGFP